MGTLCNGSTKALNQENPPLSKWVFAVDPGSHKVGYAIVHRDLSHGDMGIVTLNEAVTLINKSFAEAHPDDNPVLVVGDGTGSKCICKRFKELVKVPSICLVNERDTTLAARKKYFEENPPKGLMRLLPEGLRFPPRPLDDYAAWLIGVKYFVQNS
jgi:RNase H-fold protein (predicted Holliday junction resolvase)